MDTSRQHRLLSTPPPQAFHHHHLPCWPHRRRRRCLPPWSCHQRRFLWRARSVSSAGRAASQQEQESRGTEGRDKLRVGASGREGQWTEIGPQRKKHKATLVVQKTRHAVQSSITFTAPDTIIGDESRQLDGILDHFHLESDFDRKQTYLVGAYMLYQGKHKEQNIQKITLIQSKLWRSCALWVQFRGPKAAKLLSFYSSKILLWWCKD